LTFIQRIELDLNGEGMSMTRKRDGFVPHMLHSEVTL